MKYKLIVSDLDDTLLNDKLGYSSKLVEAIDEYVAAGGIFTVATGRMTKPMLDISRALKLKGEAISYQGAVICDIESGRIISQTCIPNPTAIEVCNYLEGLGEYYQVYEDDHILVKRCTHYSELYNKYALCRFEEHGEGLIEYIKNSGLCPVKIMIMENPSNIDRHIKELEGVFGDKLLINTSKKWLIEMVNKDISKGKAVAALAAKHGITSDEVICIGDSLNDISMIQYAGLGVCVANGDNYLKTVADYVCPSNNEDGVAHVIYKFGLEKSV